MITIKFIITIIFYEKCPHFKNHVLAVHNMRFEKFVFNSKDCQHNNESCKKKFIINGSVRLDLDPPGC